MLHEREITDLHREWKNEKTKKITGWQIWLRKNWFSWKCKICDFFADRWFPVRKRVFSKKYLHPLPDTKVNHYSDNKGNYWVHDQIVFLEYIPDNRNRRPKVLVSDKRREMYADVPEPRKLRSCWAGTVFLVVPPR